MKNIKTVGVVGAGTMGSALAQKFAQEGFIVILADREIQFVERGITGIKATLAEGIEKKVFTAVQVDSFLENLKGSANLHDLKVCDIVVEAIFEDFKAKADLFRMLSEIISATTVLATNTSSFSVTELATFVRNPERFIGLHYFYHAAKNRLVEIIPGKNTSKETINLAYRFSIVAGKDPIYTADTYGFAVNRFFVPWLNESVKLLDEKVGTVEEIDSVCMKTFGIGMGPFALMNATGVPIALHAQRTLEFFGPSYKVADLLVKQVEKKQNWSIGSMNISVNSEIAKKISDRMLGVVFFICSQILAEKVCSAIDLNKGAKIGLKWKFGPVDLMRHVGEAEVKGLVAHYCKIYTEKIPVVSASNWKTDYVLLEIKHDTAIITMNRPEDLNALNEEVVKQLDEKFAEAEKSSSVKTICITGSGKAFVAGADIKFFVKNMKNKTLDNIITFTKYGQEVFERIDKSKKKVIALINGMALGGGLELALCADIILAVQKTTVTFPETGIGIYPGLGGTQRSALRIGKGLAKYLILTGKTLTAQEAAEIGLIDQTISQQELFDILDGALQIPSPGKSVLSEKWKSIAELYTRNNYQNIVSGNYTNGFINKAEADKIGKAMSYKAPIAMQFAEQLIDEGKGPQSELEKLLPIFSTADALLGLSSIGKRVEFKGE